MLPYQLQMIETFLKHLPARTMDILEIGSDMGGEVAVELARRTGARITGINPSAEFPESTIPGNANVKFMRADGRSLPFPDNSFNAVVSVATLEHVNGIDLFLKEVTRVLKPKGLFFTEFGPIWSSAHGHHVYAVAGSKEARFWKPGKNPIPDYAHLLMTPDEMREHLCSSPCADELIDPIIHWIYFGDSINRCPYEAYLASFRKCPLLIQHMILGCDNPDQESLKKLYHQFGTERDFQCANISAVFRKIPSGAVQGRFFKGLICTRSVLSRLRTKQSALLRFLKRGFVFLFSR